MQKKHYCKKYVLYLIVIFNFRKTPLLGETSTQSEGDVTETPFEIPVDV